MFVKRSDFFEEKLSAPPECEKDYSMYVSGSMIADDDLREHLSCLKEMCTELNNAELNAALTNAEQRMDGVFSAAVFGHDAIGKNARINGIVGRKIFPESLSDEEYRRLFGNIPAVINGGNEDHIALRHGKIPHKRALFPLTAEGWQNAAEYAAKNGSRFIEISVSDTFLYGSGIELIRTDLDGDISCDCAAELVSAVQLLGEGETAALRKISGRVPFIAAAVIHIDSLSDNERGQVLSYAEKKLGVIDTDITLLAENDTDKSIREYIIGCRGRADLAERKSECMRRVLADISGRMMEIYSSRLSELAELDRQAAADAEKRISSASEAVKRTWDIIETEMLKKCAERYEWIYNRTTETQNDLLEKFRFEIEHTGDPKDWLENVYPYRMKLEMRALMKSLELNLTNAYTNDVEWLNRQVKTSFGTEIRPEPFIIVPPRTDFLQHTYPTMPDIKKARIGARIATGAAMVIGYMTLGPFAPAVGIGGGIVTDQLLGKKIAEQRKKLISTLDKGLPAALEERLGEVEKNLKTLYNNAVMSAKAAYENALEKQAAKIGEQTAAKSADGMSAVYNSRIEQLKKLKTEE